MQAIPAHSAQADALQPIASDTLSTDWENWINHLRANKQQEALAQLKQAPQVFFGLADYHYWLGVYLQNDGQQSEAAIEYELALLMDPNHAGAFFDFGLLQCRLGKTDTCQNLLNEAHRRFGKPPLISKAPVAASSWQGQVRLGTGYSNNYNQGISSQTIPLSLGADTMEFEIAPSYRPVSASYHLQTLDLAYRDAWYAQFEARASLMQKTPFSQETAVGSSNSYQLELVWHAPAGQQVLLNLKTWRDSALGSLHIAGLSWQYTRPDSKPEAPGSWIVLSGVERRQPTEPQPAYQTIAIQAQRAGLQLAGAHLYALAGLEKDLPQAQRPGLSQTRLHLATGATHPNLLPAKGLVRMNLRWAQLWDEAPYSPLFGDTRRKSQQTDASMSLTWPIDTRKQLQLDLRHSAQTSNLALFGQTETQMNLSIGVNF